MKKLTVSSKVARLVLLLFLGLFAFTFAAVPSEAGETFINIGTGTTGGTYYPAGAAMAKIWSSVGERAVDGRHGSEHPTHGGWRGGGRLCGRPLLLRL